MAETFRIAKVMKFIDTLRALREVEIEHTLIFGNGLSERLREILPNKQICKQDDIYKSIDTITEYSYKKDGISLSHSQLLFLKETMFHLGCTQITEDIIKEIAKFFDLDIPEINKKKSGIENYDTKSIETNDYSTILRKFYLILGGMGKSVSEQIQEECAQHCITVLLKILQENEIDRVEDGFIIRTPLQNIPNISNELINNNIGIYGIIPIQDK